MPLRRVFARSARAAAGAIAPCFLFLLVAATADAAGARRSPARGRPAAGPRPPAPNTLTPAEVAEGWVLLFDGRTTGGWRGLGQAGFPGWGWNVEDGALKRVPEDAGNKKKAGDVITTASYAAFDLRFDWRLLPGGNSGVKYLIDEKLAQGGHGVGFEFQILDDAAHPDAAKGKAGTRTCGALYDLIAPAQHAARPVGEWNQARIVVHGPRVEHWLNGVKVVEFGRGGPALAAAIADSKFKDTAGFGAAGAGPILIQDHASEAWFRNIKLRPLGSAAAPDAGTPAAPDARRPPGVWKVNAGQAARVERSMPIRLPAKRTP